MSPPEPKFEDCRPVCPETQDRWVLPAGILNVLWGDVIPLLAARCWRGGPCVIGAGNAQLASLIQGLPGWSRNGPWKARAQLAVDYLGRPDAAPIRVVGEGAYDFLLSNHGVDFFLPERPETAEDLYHFYTYRRTGQDPIAIPGYLNEPVSALSTQARTGPSQIWIDPQAILDIADLLPVGCDEAAGVRGKVQRMVERSKPARKALEERAAKAALRRQGPDAPPDERLQIRLEGVGNLVCLLHDFRCWQLEGAVAQAIFTETPRVVATIWLGTGTYGSRWPDPGDEGLREIFEERLEVTVPDADHMAFTQQPSPAPTSPSWDEHDIMVTSRGLFFPPLPASPPGFEDMLDEIVDGRAANPVFTDSRPPPFP